MFDIKIWPEKVILSFILQNKKIIMRVPLFIISKTIKTNIENTLKLNKIKNPIVNST